MPTFRYRKEFNKLFKRIDKIAQKGTEAILEYKELLDELVTTGQYQYLADVLLVKYGIDISEAESIQQVKNNTFSDIRRVTNFTPQIFLKNLTDENGVYSLGYHFYDSSNSHYLGDIVEIDRIGDLEKKTLDIYIDLEVVVGNSASILYAISTFYDDPTTRIKFEEESQVLYGGKIYHCIEPYTYSNTNRITPTFSAYWDQVSAPSYSLTSFTGSSTTLLEKYSLAIDNLKSYSYTII